MEMLIKMESLYRSNENQNERKKEEDSNRLLCTAAAAVPFFSFLFNRTYFSRAFLGSQVEMIPIKISYTHARVDRNDEVRPLRSAVRTKRSYFFGI